MKVESFDNSLRKLAHSIFKYRNDAKNDPRLFENIGSLKKIIDQLLERGRKAEALTALGNGKKEVQKCERYALQTERLVSELSEKFRDEQQIISFAKKLHFVVHDLSNFQIDEKYRVISNYYENTKTLLGIDEYRSDSENRVLGSGESAGSRSSVSTRQSITMPDRRSSPRPIALQRSTSSSSSVALESDGRSSRRALERPGGKKIISLFAAILKGNQWKNKTPSIHSLASLASEGERRKQNVSIQDFEIIKPISRGAFGYVPS